MTETTDHAAELRALADSTYFAPTIVGFRLNAAANEIARLRARVAELEAQLARLMPPMADPSAFKHELAIYADHKEKWLAWGMEGQFAVIKGDSAGGGFATYNEALDYGYKTYGLTPFVVKRITAIEPVLYMRPG